jgi:thiol-disulfide isomerase/thioredoxin
MKRKAVWLVALSLLTVLAGCTAESTDGESSGTGDAPGAWIETELTDVVTGETFRVSDLEGTPVLVESFAVWCPTCLKQLQEMTELLEQTDEVVLVALDTDPNEDADRVRDHVERYGLAGRFAVAPQEMTDALVDEYGPTIVSVPTAPVVLVDADQESARLLQRGVKPAGDLLEEIGQ